MKTSYDFKYKAMEFAKKEGSSFDAVQTIGIYENYEVYEAYCKEWKKNPPKVGLPQVILVNWDEVKWAEPGKVLEILRESRKIPSVVFEYDCRGWNGKSFDYKLMADGTLVKLEYRFSKLLSKVEKGENFEKIICVSPELVEGVKKIIAKNKETLRNLPRELSNPNVLDGGYETIRFGRMKFEGSNMLAESMKSFVEYFSVQKAEGPYSFIYPLYEVQKVFKKIERLTSKYCNGEKLIKDGYAKVPLHPLV